MRKQIRAFLDHIVPGPAFGLWSWRYLDKWRTVKLVMSRRVWRMYTKFHEHHPVGSKLPPIDLPRTDGSRVSTEAFNGEKHFVIWAGAIT